VKIYLLLSAWVAPGDRNAFQKVVAAYQFREFAEVALKERNSDFLNHGKKIFWIEETDMLP
jgi:hypothetical protein